jgi:hypothetical protein
MGYWCLTLLLKYFRCIGMVVFIGGRGKSKDHVATHIQNSSDIEYTLSGGSTTGDEHG